MKPIKIIAVLKMLVVGVALPSASMASTATPAVQSSNAMPAGTASFKSAAPPAKITITYQQIDVPRPAWNMLLQTFQNNDQAIARRVLKTYRPSRIDSETVAEYQTLRIDMGVTRTDLNSRQPSAVPGTDYLRTGDDVSIVPGHPIGNLIETYVDLKSSWTADTPSILVDPTVYTRSDNQVMRLQSGVPTILVTPSEMTPGNTQTTVRVTLITATAVAN